MALTEHRVDRVARQLVFVLALLSGPAMVTGPTAVNAATVPDQDCVIEPNTVVDLASAVEGIVQTVEVARGDVVERNQVLVTLDSGVERAAVDYARARAEASAQVRAGEANASFAQRRASRVGVLYEQKVVSSDQMDEAATQTRLTRAQAEQAAENQKLAQLELRQAQENLARHVIRSPIRGVVVQDYLSPGESVKDKPILRLAEIDPLRVEVIVPVAYFGAIVPGQSATVLPEAPREGSVAAKVTIVDRVADAASGTFRVRLRLPNADYSLPSGLKCRVQFGAAPPAGASPPAPAPAPRPATPAALQGDTVAGLRPASSYPRTRRVSHTISHPAPAVAAGLATPAPTEIAAAPSCRTVGPIDSRAHADQIKAVLAGNVRRVAVRPGADRRSTDYLILSAAQATADEARLLATQLREAGIGDLHVYARGAFANRIGLGLYAGPKTAEARRAALAILGFETEVVQRARGDQPLWLDIEVASTVAADEALRQALAPVAPRLDLAPIPCSSLVAARQ